ncbi:hypothetical protein [uncultured Tyzzerella sp.]|uniref:glycoside hydrolase family 19 protein n=1 Tax=uncultured Tyzzerella sp. TaxID=2321398 RepID=UPI002942DB77|nr:hypothetical protein [uncultured Tyzzerella sp.]
MNKDNTVEMGIVTNGAKKYLSKNDEKFLKNIRENNTKSYGNEQFMQAILDNKSINMDKNKSIEEFDRLEKVDIIKFHTKSNGRIQEDYLEYKKDNMITNNLNIKKIFEMGYRENISKRNEKTEINTKKEGFFKKIKVKYIYTTYYFEREIIPVYLKIINNQSIKQEYICTGYYIENNGGHTYTEFVQKLFNKLGCTLEDDNNNYYLLKIEEKDFKIIKPKELGYVLDNIKFSNINELLKSLLNIKIIWEWQNKRLNLIRKIYVEKEQLIHIGFLKEYVTDSMINELNFILEKYEINTVPRIRHFLSQVCHESFRGSLTIEVGKDEYFYKYINVLGNTNSEDALLYRGAGYIQITGKDTYLSYSKYLGDELIVTEGYKRVSKFYAWDASGWYWRDYKKYANLNRLCDEGASVEQITKIVNGRNMNGLAERKEFYKKACQIIK